MSDASRSSTPRLSPDWLATLLAVALAGLAWAGVLPHVGW
jgi:hypothetical protein